MDIVQFGRVISQGIGNNWVSRSAFRKGDDRAAQWPASLGGGDQHLPAGIQS